MQIDVNAILSFLGQSWLQVASVVVAALVLLRQIASGRPRLEVVVTESGFTVYEEDRAEANIRIRCSQRTTSIERLTFRMDYVFSYHGGEWTHFVEWPDLGGERTHFEKPDMRSTWSTISIDEKIALKEPIPRALPLQIAAGSTRYFRVEFIGLFWAKDAIECMREGSYKIRRIKNCVLFVETTQRTFKFRISQCAFETASGDRVTWSRSWDSR